jgi:xylulokinase
MLSDVIQFPLDLPAGAETGAAFGAARLGMLAAGAGTEAEICFKPDIKLSYPPNGGEKAFYAPRLARFRALYEAERQIRTSLKG